VSADWSPRGGTGDNAGVEDQQRDTRPPLPSSTARYGALEGPEATQEAPELFPGEKALARTKAGSRDEMRVLRRHYNWVNMVIALVACLALVLAALALAPRPEGDITREVDYGEVARTVQPDAAFGLAVPPLPEGWEANAASFGQQGTPAADTWYVSWVDGDDGWASLRQADADDTPDAWAESFLEEFAETGESELGGADFTRFEGTSSSDMALLGEADGTILLLVGEGEWGPLEEFAAGSVQTIGDVESDG